MSQSEERIIEEAQIARERVKNEAFGKTETGYALDITKVREIIIESLTKIASLAQEETKQKIKEYIIKKKQDSICGCGMLNCSHYGYNRSVEDIIKDINQMQ